MAKVSVAISVSETGKRSPIWDIETDLNGEITLGQLLTFTKNSLLTISDVALKEEQAKGFDSKPILKVDGKFNRRKEEVDPLGKIEYIARQSMADIIMFAYSEIARRSPEKTGAYKSVNLVTFNGRTVAYDMATLKTWLSSKDSFKDKDIIRLINTSPYARKLERFGITAQTQGRGALGRIKRKLSYEGRRLKQSPQPNNQVQVPNGTYALAYRAIQRKYKNNSFIRFRLLSGSELDLVGEGRTYKTGKGAGRPYFYPTILISAVAAGLKDGIEA